MRRFSILGMMGVVSAVAVAFAALRGANPHWAGAAHTLTLGLIAFAILASIRGRAGWLGFPVVGGGYFLAIRTLPTADERPAAPGRPAGSGWATILPGGANLTSFRAIAHDLFALAFGGLGVLASRRMGWQYPPSAGESPRTDVRSVGVTPDPPFPEKPCPS